MAVKLRRYTTCDSGKIGICIKLLLRRRQAVETLAVLRIIPVLLVVGFFPKVCEQNFRGTHRFEAAGHYFRLDMLMTFYAHYPFQNRCNDSAWFGWVQSSILRQIYVFTQLVLCRRETVGVGWIHQILHKIVRVVFKLLKQRRGCSGSVQRRYCWFHVCVVERGEDCIFIR